MSELRQWLQTTSGTTGAHVAEAAEEMSRCLTLALDEHGGWDEFLRDAPAALARFKEIELMVKGET